MTTRAGLAPADPGLLAERIARATTNCPGVAGLMAAAPGGPVATYMPGRTISGVAVRPREIEVCVNARYGPPLPDVAAQVRQAAAEQAPGRAVHVVIGDIARECDSGPRVR